MGALEAAGRSFDVTNRIRIAAADRVVPRPHRVGEHLSRRSPDVARHLPRDGRGLDLPVEVPREPAQVVHGPLAHVFAADRRRDVRLVVRSVVAGRRLAPRGPRSHPSVQPRAHLRRGRLARAPAKEACALFREEFPRFVLFLRGGLRVKLRALFGAQAARGRCVLVGHVDAHPGAVGETDAGAEVAGAVGAAARLDGVGAGRRHRRTIPPRSGGRAALSGVTPSLAATGERAVAASGMENMKGANLAVVLPPSSASARRAVQEHQASPLRQPRQGDAPPHVVLPSSARTLRCATPGNAPKAPNGASA